MRFDEWFINQPRGRYVESDQRAAWNAALDEAARIARAERRAAITWDGTEAIAACAACDNIANAVESAKSEGKK